MIPSVHDIPIEQLSGSVRSLLKDKEQRLGFITSIDGKQLVTLLLNTRNSAVSVLMTQLNSDSYPSLTATVPQAHWYERTLHDLFGLNPIGHPRLKPVVINEAFIGKYAPLRNPKNPVSQYSRNARDFSYLHVRGEDIYELPVGPVHAGIIEPGHFRLSCLGESVINLEIRLGFVHRGVEKRLTEVPLHKARFVAECAATDTAAANALAHAVAVESIVSREIPVRAQYLRTLALEIERLAMHIADVGGMAVDLGYLTVAAAGSRLRGSALRMADLLSGNRFIRGFIAPGGVTNNPDMYLSEIKSTSKDLRKRLKPLIDCFLSNPNAYERLRGNAKLSQSLAEEFGIVGVAARASNIAYDTRSVFSYATYPKDAPPIALDKHGDALSRILVRVQEIYSSFDLIDNVLDNIPTGPVRANMPSILPGGAIGIGIVEAFRGELIHMLFTDDSGKIKRYAIKDPSVNNWTGVAIAVRNNVIADFPVCNKSFGLAYSGHDL